MKCSHPIKIISRYTFEFEVLEFHACLNTKLQLTEAPQIYVYFQHYPSIHCFEIKKANQHFEGADVTGTPLLGVYQLLSIIYYDQCEFVDQSLISLSSQSF